MIDRKFNSSVSHKKMRLHSSERNTTWGSIFDEYKNSLTEEDLKFYPNTDELKKPLSKFYGYDNFLMGFGSDRCIKYFFESNSEKDIDIIIGVTAPEQIRIERVMQRTDYSKEEVIKRMQQQMPDEEKMAKCNYVIQNNDTDAILPQILQIHQQLINKSVTTL